MERSLDPPLGLLAQLAQTPLPAAESDCSIDVLSSDQSFAAFWDRSHAPVARALAITLGDSELASDATNEAMTRAYQRWAKICQYDNPAGWVYRVGLNWSTSWLRRRRREREQPIAFSPAVDTFDLRDDTLDQALDSLSVDHRAVLVCRIHLDWSVGETASALGIAPGTVKSRHARALQSLRAAMDEEQR